MALCWYDSRGMALPASRTTRDPNTQAYRDVDRCAHHSSANLYGVAAPSDHHTGTNPADEYAAAVHPDSHTYRYANGDPNANGYSDGHASSPAHTAGTTRTITGKNV